MYSVDLLMCLCQVSVVSTLENMVFSAIFIHNAQEGGTPRVSCSVCILNGNR